MLRLILFLVLLVPGSSYADNMQGEFLFNRNCATCHKRTAPNIISTKLKSYPVPMIVKNGRPGTMMGSFKRKFNDEEILSIHSYLSSQ